MWKEPICDNEKGNISEVICHTYISACRCSWNASTYKQKVHKEQIEIITFVVMCRWFSPGIPASSTFKTGRLDIAEILLKVELNTIQLTKIYR
jgi:hypothetical protein